MTERKIGDIVWFNAWHMLGCDALVGVIIYCDSPSKTYTIASKRDIHKSVNEADILDEADAEGPLEFLAGLVKRHRKSGTYRLQYEVELLYAMERLSIWKPKLKRKE